MTTSETTRVYGLVGSPVDQSLSPFIMERAFAEFDLDNVYVAFDVEPDLFPNLVQELRTLGIMGANITYPYKERILEFVDRCSPDVETIRAANTLRFEGGGWEAHNTDAPGVVNALEILGDVKPAGKRVFVFGAGGAGRAAGFGLLKAGASCVTFGLRDPSKARRFIEKYRNLFPDQRIESVSLTGDEPARAIETAAVIINATPVGMAQASSGERLGDESWINGSHVCFDFVYNRGETPFLAGAERRKARTLDGLALLVAQAQATFRLWTGKEFSLERMYTAVAIEQQMNRE